MKRTLAPGMYADLAVLSVDYLTSPPEEIRSIASVLTVVGGRVVYGDGDYADLSPALPPASPSWSPVNAEPSPAERAEPSRDNSVISLRMRHRLAASASR